nr:DEAD-box helicase Dbp80-like [Maniola hyperantus]
MTIIPQGLIEPELDIEIQKNDPNSPLYSVKTFEALHLKPNLLKGVYAMGLSAPSKMQETVLPTLLSDPPQNMLVQSPSGTGKTTAFVLAMLSRVDPTENYPQVLFLHRTLELAIQIGEVAAEMAKFCPEIKLKCYIRGEEVPKGTKITDHILIGNPSKILDWGVKFGMFDLSKIKVFVLADFDVMIDRQGHQNQIIRIHKVLPSTCQMMLFSTAHDSDSVMEFVEIIVPNLFIVRVKEL